MEAFLFSTLSVAIAEIGDKTQLLALVLAARYRRFWPVTLGILVATLLNHGLAGWLGELLAGLMSPETQRWVIIASFVAVAISALVPVKLDEDDKPASSAHGAFIATLIAFFLVEIGDKTQVATVILAARYHDLLAVVGGSTLGMLLANVPVVALGGRFAGKLPLHWARWAAAAIFLTLAVLLWLRVV